MSGVCCRLARNLFAVVLVLVALGATAHAQDNLAAWLDFDFTKQSIKPDQFKGLSLDSLKLLRGIVFGRHGRVFKDNEIKAYLEDQSWYKQNPDFSNSILNDVERRNLDLIRDAEASQHQTVQPGDMRFWRTRPLTTKKLGAHSGAEWLVLRSEVEAIHGQRFNDEPWLQRYFDERYWYRASDRFDPKALSALEQKNLATIAEAQKRSRKIALAPGDMELFENRNISEQMLRGLS